MIDQVDVVIWDALHNNRALVRGIMNATADNASHDDDYASVNGDAWRLLEDSRDLMEGLRSGDLTASDLDSWLGEVEDLGNDYSCLPRYPEGD